jgi:hypothetical protein
MNGINHICDGCVEIMLLPFLSSPSSSKMGSPCIIPP